MVLLVRNKENAQKSFLGIVNTIYIENSVENVDLSKGWYDKDHKETE